MRRPERGSFCCEIPAEAAGKGHHSRAARDDRDVRRPLQRSRATARSAP